MKRIVATAIIGFLSAGLLFSQPSKTLENLIETAKLIAEKEEEPLVKTIAHFQSELEKFNAVEQAIINSMIAECLWSYLQQNRFEIFERTPLANPDLTDVRTWDTRLLLQQTIAYYQRSLQPREALQKMQIRNYKEVLTLGDNESEIQRPTMFDFLAHRAIDAWNRHDLRLTQPQDGFVIDNPQYFSRADVFATFEIPSIDTLSLDYQISKTYQLLCQFHASQNNPDILIPLDLQRFAWIREKAVFENADSLYKLALENYLSVYPNHDHKAVAQIYWALAEFHNELGNRYNSSISEDFRWEKKTAMEYTKIIETLYPNTRFAQSARALSADIKQKNIKLQMQEVVLPNQHNLFLMRYANVTPVYFSLYRLSENELKTDEFLSEYRSYFTDIARDIARKEKFYKQWESAVPDSGDFQMHRVEMSLPPLPAGYYVLFASPRKSMSDVEDVEMQIFGVSELTYIAATANQKLEGVVLNRRTGKPISNVKVRLYSREYDYETRRMKVVERAMLTSAKNGQFEYSKNNNESSSVFVELQHKSDTLLASQNQSHWWHTYSQQENWRRETFLFTDRAIYRPGQTVYFKGIFIERKGDETQLMPAFTSTTVKLFNANYKEISSVEVRVNEYGSFSGNFVLPTTGLNGQYYLQGDNGWNYFSVEEYKRPTFEITFNPLEDAYKLNQELTVSGFSKTYSGAGLGQSAVKYKVMRSAFIPWRWWRSFYPFASEETAITQGETACDENGRFEISFTAYSDKRIPLSQNPTYTFTVTAEITDVSGETQQAVQHILISQKALNVSLNVRPYTDKTKDSVLLISSTNLSGLKTPSRGTIRVFRLWDTRALLQNRLWEDPDRFVLSESEFIKRFPNAPYRNENKREHRDRTLVLEKSYNTEKDEKFVLSGLPKWLVGDYCYAIETQDMFGNPVKNEIFFTIYSPSSGKKEVLKNVYYTILPKNTFEPGETASWIIGTAAKITVFYELRDKNGVIEHREISLNNEQKRIEIPIKESHRGNLSLQIWCVENNRLYTTTETISVPFSNKNITISLETFRDKLTPNAQENWTLQLLSNDKKPLQGELLLSMYDASLDVFQKNIWRMNLNRYHYATSPWRSNLFQTKTSQQLWFSSGYYYPPPIRHDALNFSPPFSFRRIGRAMRNVGASAKSLEAVELEIVADDSDVEHEIMISSRVVAEETSDVSISSAPQELEVSEILTPRTNLNETAFFYPHLRSDESGQISVLFTVPESLTRWRIQGLAHTKDLKIGMNEWSVVTQKDLMVYPNVPRFLREGDVIKLQAKIVNLLNEPILGEANLCWTLANQFGPILAEEKWSKNFSIAPLQNTSVVWAQRFDGVGLLNLTFSAKAGNHTDGEVQMIPVLSNRALLTETMPMFVAPKSNRTFSFAKLGKPNSNTLENHRLTLEVATNPIWFAVQALPELSSPNAQNSIALFGAYFANAMAIDILERNPEIKEVFNRWKIAGSETLKSNLETNQDLKSVLLDETPWVLAAESETRQKQNIALFFDENNVRNLQSDVLVRLQKLQVSNGGFAWYPGGRDDLWNTQYIVHGLQRLHRRNIERNNFDLQNILQNALKYCDEQHIEYYSKIKKQNLKINLSANDIHYLYLRTYFEKEHPVSPELTEVLDVYDSLAKATWQNRSRYLQGILALYFDLKNDSKMVQGIMQNFQRLALKSPEFGMYWRYEPSWFWYESPIETQSLLIETFEKLGRSEDVDAMKQWLLTQKRTTRWNTPKASVEAVWALLLNTPNLDENTNVEIQIGNEKISTPTAADAGSGYFTRFWTADKINEKQAQVIVKNQGNSMVWGGLYWQYFENLDKVTPAATPLSIQKTLFVERMTNRGTVLESIPREGLKIGDKVVVRIEIRTDRDMDYVHLKDLRAAAFEPVDMRSGYRFQDGLFYYQDAKDVSMNFYFSRLPRGTYVFEYRVNVSQIGNFSNGYTTIQCLYAPEFSAQSQGERVVVN
jgi:uncharacterized protein YfaS (alpha-2-macroglobulin family)